MRALDYPATCGTKTMRKKRQKKIERHEDSAEDSGGSERATRYAEWKITVQLYRIRQSNMSKLSKFNEVGQIVAQNWPKVLEFGQIIIFVNFGQNVVEDTVILKRNDVWSGAKVGESCRSRKMLQPECFRVKIVYNTAGNEPPQRSFQGPYVARENKSLKNVSIRCQWKYFSTLSMGETTFVWKLMRSSRSAQMQGRKECTVDANCVQLRTFSKETQETWRPSCPCLRGVLRK